MNAEEIYITMGKILSGKAWKYLWLEAREIAVIAQQRFEGSNYATLAENP